MERCWYQRSRISLRLGSFHFHLQLLERPGCNFRACKYLTGNVCGEARKRQRQQSSLHGAVLEEPPVTSLMSSLQVSTCLLLISSSRRVLSQRTAAAVVKTCCYFCQKLPEISARLKLQPEAAELTALGEAERPLNQHLCVWSELPWQPEEAQAGTGMFMGCHW